MDCLPIPQFSLDFLLRSKTYLKEHPPSSSIIKLAGGCGETGLYMLQAANYTATRWFTLVQGA